ncbi:MAG: nuclear transport factor 2 family protein [Anaerolineales bacterium]|jgi:ketosteroid isomerase-like protein
MSPARMSRLEAAVRVVLEFTDAFNRHDVAGMLALLAGGCAFEGWTPAGDSAAYVGKEKISDYLQHYFQQTANASMTVEDIFSAGMRCILRWQIVAHDLDGKQAALRGVDICKVNGGLISEKLTYFHRAGAGAKLH